MSYLKTSFWVTKDNVFLFKKEESGKWGWFIAPKGAKKSIYEQASLLNDSGFPSQFSIIVEAKEVLYSVFEPFLDSQSIDKRTRLASRKRLLFPKQFVLSGNSGNWSVTFSFSLPETIRQTMAKQLGSLKKSYATRALLLQAILDATYRVQKTMPFQNMNQREREWILFYLQEKASAKVMTSNF